MNLKSLRSLHAKMDVALQRFGLTRDTLNTDTFQVAFRQAALRAHPSEGGTLQEFHQVLTSGYLLSHHLSCAPDFIQDLLLDLFYQEDTDQRITGYQDPTQLKGANLLIAYDIWEPPIAISCESLPAMEEIIAVRSTLEST